MSFLIISARFNGVVFRETVVGDEFSDPELMAYLNARQAIYKDPKSQLHQQQRQFLESNRFQHYWCTEHQPRVVLNLLAARGYQLQSMVAGGDELYLWTLFKPS